MHAIPDHVQRLREVGEILRDAGTACAGDGTLCSTAKTPFNLDPMAPIPIGSAKNKVGCTIIAPIHF